MSNEITINLSDIRNKAKAKSNAHLLRDSDIRDFLAKYNAIEIRETTRASESSQRAFTTMRHKPTLPTVVYIYNEICKSADERKIAAIIAVAEYMLRDTRDNAKFVSKVNELLTAAANAKLIDASKAATIAKRLLETTPIFVK